MAVLDCCLLVVCKISYTFCVLIPLHVGFITSGRWIRVGAISAVAERVPGCWTRVQLVNDLLAVLVRPRRKQILRFYLFLDLVSRRLRVVAVTPHYIGYAQWIFAVHFRVRVIGHLQMDVTVGQRIDAGGVHFSRNADEILIPLLLCDLVAEHELEEFHILAETVHLVLVMGLCLSLDLRRVLAAEEVGISRILAGGSCLVAAL